MTKYRPPLSLDAALERASEILRGRGAMAEITGHSTSLVYSWGDPERREKIPVHDAILLDQACRAATGEVPFFTYYGSRLYPDGGASPLPGALLAAHTAEVARECGEAIAALVESAVGPAASLDDRIRHAREVEQAIAVLQRALPLLLGADAFAALYDPGTADQRATGPPQPPG